MENLRKSVEIQGSDRLTHSKILPYFIIRNISQPKGVKKSINFHFTLISSDDVVAVFIKGTAHCANMYPSSERDTEELKKARKLIGDIVSKWLD